MAKHIPDPKTVKKVLEPGIWEDHDGALHFCATTWLENHGVEPTPRNIEAADGVFSALCREQFPGVKVIEKYEQR